MKLEARLLLIMWVLFWEQQSVCAQEDWVFVGNENDVAIYTRQVAGHAESEFKGISIIHRPIEVLGAVLLDIPDYPRWFHRCTEIEIVSREADSGYNFIIYIIIDPPWPLANRDIIYKTRTVVEMTHGTVRVESEALKETLIPLREDFVRITDSKVRWTLERLAPDQTQVSFVQRTNIGGSAGAYLSNLGSKRSILDSLVNMREIAADPKYVDLGKRLKENFTRK